MIAAANAVAGGFLAERRQPGRGELQLKHFILAAIAGSGIFVILLGLVAAALCVFLFECPDLRGIGIVPSDGA